MTARVKVARTALLFVASGALWLIVAAMICNPLAVGLLPGIHWAMESAVPEFKVLGLRIISLGLESAIEANVIARHATGAFPIGTPMNSSTLMSHLVQPLILMFSIITTGWFLRRRNVTALLTATIPLALVVVMVDVPFVLAGALRDLMEANDQSGEAAPSFLVAWMHFLNGGGRFALGIVAGMFVLAISRDATQ